MFEGAVAGILNRLLGKYVQDLDTENLNVGIFSGNVNLTDLKLKPEALYELDLPIDVKIGTIGRISFQIPWSGLYTQPVIVNIEDVLLLVGPAISNSHFDPEREKRLTRAAKRKILQDLEAESEILKGPQNFFESLFTAIVNNVQVYVRNVHVRYEDCISSKEGPMACGLCLQSLSIETTNSKWKPSVTPAAATTVYQLMRLESLSLYWNPRSAAADEADAAPLSPMQYYNWKHYMLTGLDKFSMHQEDFDFLLKPLSCKVKVLINRSGEARAPRLLLDAVVHDCSLQLSRRQFLSMDNLLASFRRMQLNRRFRHLHPGSGPAGHARRWWRYAGRAVVEQRVRPYTWAALRRHRAHYAAYKQAYTRTLRSPNDTELKLDLQQCEDRLPLVSVLVAREQAKFELLPAEPERIALVQDEHTWRAAAPALCVRSERRTLWTHLSSPERRRVCELLGYVEGAPRDHSKLAIEHKLNLTLANCSLTLTNRGKEILGVTVTQFLASLETRPSAKAYKVSARAENIVVDGLTSEGELAPLVTSPGAGTVLALDLERNPHHVAADYAFCCLLEPLELSYIEHAFTELLNFVQTPSVPACGAGGALRAARRVVQRGTAAARRAVLRRALLHVSVDVRAPCVVLPDAGCVHKSGHVMVVDISRIIIRSDLQPTELALEDATCMELEERLYDRLHAELSVQVLFCKWDDPWRERRKSADSDLHLVPKIKATVVFSNSIKKEYKLLPRYKLNISLSSLKLNLSERVIGLLLDFADSLPVPAPTAVPLALADSRHASETEDAAMDLDRVRADPSHAELVKLRQAIVAAYLSRNKPAESNSASAAAPCAPAAACAGSEQSDEDLELVARSVDLPGFEDNVSPSNTINTLLRFIIGEIVINLSRSMEAGDRPYVTLAVSKLCLDVALLRYGPAVQLSAGAAQLVDRLQAAEPVPLLASQGELLNLLYRKVRADCPEFRSQFHAVEQSLVLDVGGLALRLHAAALAALAHHLHHLHTKIQTRHPVNWKGVVLPKARELCHYIMRPEADPPVPSGATKFSYSIRSSSISIKLCHSEYSMMELRLGALESDCVFRANDRMTLRLFLSSLQLDHLGEATLYPKLIWPDEDKVIELKYVRCAPRVFGAAELKAHGELRLYVGRLHAVCSTDLLHSTQQLLEPLIPQAVAQSAARAAESAAERHSQGFRSWSTRLNLVIEIHAPVLLLPQKPSSPNLLVLNMGDLLIENLFKQVSPPDPASPAGAPVIDNILLRLQDITFARAVMTLAGTLEVQEPILEPLCIRCDIARCAGYRQAGGARAALAVGADVRADAVSLNLGQKDLATVLAVWADNLSLDHLIGSIVPTSPVEVPQSDASVKKLQAFFAQGEPIKKEAAISFTLEGLTLRLYSDLDEVLSSPVRDANNGLARLSAGEASAHLDCFSDGSLELRASLVSLLLDDIRPAPHVLIQRIFESQGGSRRSTGGISVRRPPLIDAHLRVTGARARQLDVRVDRTRLNLSPPFFLTLARCLLDAMPGEKTLEGGVVNHGYVGEPRAPLSTADSTSGCYSAGNSVSEESPNLAISVQFRQPEVMCFAAGGKAEGHALLLRTELLVDYSSHGGTESLVVSLAGLQVMSKLQSKLKNLPPQLVLKPCDIEFSRTFKNMEEGIRVKVSVSEIELHIAATTIHTITDILDEIQSEMQIPEEREPFKFANPRSEKADEDLWAPRALAAGGGRPAGGPPGGGRPAGGPPEALHARLPEVRIVLELEHSVRIPVLMLKFTLEVRLSEWSRRLRGSGALTAQGSVYNERADAWEPLLEPCVVAENLYRPWELTATIFQDKAHSMSTRLETTSQPATEPEPTESKKRKKRNEFESETSADECDTDNEMTFIRNPSGRERPCDLEFGSMAFLGGLEHDESDSENENGLMDKLATAIGHLFTDESSCEELSNGEDSSAPQSDGDADDEDNERAVTFEDGLKRKEPDHKQDTTHGSADSGLDTDSGEERLCTYVLVEARDVLNLTVTPGAARVLAALRRALADRAAALSGIVTAQDGITLVNDIGPGSTVHLTSRTETDLAGNDRVIAIADYDVDNSRPSTPGCDTSIGDLLDEAEEKPKQEMTDISDEWDCFSGGFPGAGPPAPAARAWSPRAPASPPALRARLTGLALSVRLHDLDRLDILCPQRTVSKLHVLHPSKNSTRYYIVVERQSNYNSKTIIVRSPLQVRNETSYALELFYNKKDLQAIGADLIGSLTNPFDDKMKLAVIAPQQTYNVPLYIAYHCKLYLLPSNFESYQTATQGIWWMELANDLGTPRDLICPAKDGEDKRIFAMRILAVEGIQSHKVSRTIPNYLVRIVPPLALYNRLPYAIEMSCAAKEWSVRIESGERLHTYTLQITHSHRLAISMNYQGALWTGSFSLSPDITEKCVNLTPDWVTKRVGVPPTQICVTVERNECWQLYVHAHYWFINKTGLPLEMKGRHSDTVVALPALGAPALWSGRWAGGARARFRAHASAWSRAVRLPPAAPGLVVCAHTERRTNYRILLHVTLSELSPQLTKIVTLLPYFIVSNETRRALRYMEENEAADLWMDLPAGARVPFHPATDSMAMHCKLRDSALLSHRFPIATEHVTVLRMDKGSAIRVEVTGGVERPFLISFLPYVAGDAPVRVDNRCEDLFLKLHQEDSGQVALLSPYQSMLYTWDDPGKERTLMWNIYNNKGKGFVADFASDGYGEEKVSFHSVKQATLVSTGSVTSKLSSTLKRLAPRSPEPCASSSGDSDSSDLPEAHAKTKKMRKDKVIVYWVSYMDGYQRVFLLAQDERIANQYRLKVNSERSNYEVYMALTGVSLSVCVQRNDVVKELAYASISDALPRWEVNVNHKWKQLAPDLTTWIEDKYQAEQKKCELKEYIHIDLEKMQMTKPFFSELRRSYSPGAWLQYRRSDTLAFLHLKLHRLQVDNQLGEAVFPSVLYPAPPSPDARLAEPKPCVELVCLKQARPALNQTVYKYLKVLVQEYSVNLDRGFVNYVFDILNHWKVEEKPAVRLRADLALVHQPLPAPCSAAQRNVLFEFAHLSPVRLVLALSSRGLADDAGGPRAARRENRPKLFNSDLLEYLFNSWGSSLCDMKDVVFRMSYLEVRGAALPAGALAAAASRHYWPQLVQQFHVLVLGQHILGNPHSRLGDFAQGLKHYYEPSQGSCSGRHALAVSARLMRAAAGVLGLCAPRAAGLEAPPAVRGASRRPELEVIGNDLPASVLAADSSAAGLALALTALVARPTFDMCRALGGAGPGGAERALRAARLVARRRVPRHCPLAEALRPFSLHAALGAALTAAAARPAQRYLAHALLPPHHAAALLLTTQHLYMVRSGAGGAWRAEWSVRLDELLGLPAVQGGALRLTIRQDEQVSYFSSDEKVIEVPDSELLRWLAERLHCALILTLEDRRTDRDHRDQRDHRD